MQDAVLWGSVVGIPVVVGATLLYLALKKPAWKLPIRWACTGIFFFKLFEYGVEFLIRGEL